VKLTNGWKKLQRIAQGPHASELVPVLGSGFVTQAVMEGSRQPGAAKRPPPVDWMALLEGVAREFACHHAASHVENDVPGQTTLLWDAMVAELTTRKPRTRSAYEWEARMRRSVARRLREDQATPELARGFVESFLRLGWDDVLSFNFDRVLLSRGAKIAHGAKGPSRRASLAARADQRSIWFPHGHMADPESIVLGAHAYGVRIAAMQAAFDAHARLRAPRPTKALATWVAIALERPLLFVGLSLTREEWTIWWLLTQRARFLARRAPARRPPAFVFARRPSSSERLEAHAAFQTLARASELLGLTLLEFSDFRAGWKKLRGAIGWPL